MWFVPVFILALFVFVLAVSSLKVIRQSTVGVIERLGRFHMLAQRGVNFIVPFIDHIRAIIDLREQVADFPPHPVITKDNVTMQIDTVIYFQVTDPLKYVYEIANPIAAIEYLAVTTLRNIIGDLDLDQTLTSRDTINDRLRIILDEATDKWGIKVNRVELKNIIPPKDIQAAMEKQMRAERERRESILRAEGEKRSAILAAEGLRESKILTAEAEKEAAIRAAEGQRQSSILRAEGEAEAIRAVEKAKADGIRMVYQAIMETQPTKELLAIRSLEALEKVANGQATKLVVPTEVAAMLGSITGIKEALAGDGK
jgi:regulator of protease activity HflC (stomatin/prohibitin superfamily)